MRTVTNLMTTLVLALLIAAPAYAGPDEQVALRAVANIARMAIGTNCTDPEGSWTFGPPPPDFFNGGTPNQKILVRVWHYGWALKSNPRPSDLGTIRSTLLDFINRQQQSTSSYNGQSGLGHYATALGANEELTSSHYQLWSGAMAAAYLFAIANGGTLTVASEGSTPETAIRNATRKWWSDEQALYDRLYVVLGNGQLDAPGARFANTFPTGGALKSNDLRDDIYRLLKGEAPLTPRNCSAERQVTSSFVMQALTSKGVPRLGLPPGGHTPGAKLYDTLCVYRMGTTDWTLYFPNMRNVTGALYWVQFRNNTLTRSPVPYNGVKPASYLPNSASLDPIAGVVTGAANCPPPDQINQ